MDTMTEFGYWLTSQTYESHRWLADQVGAPPQHVHEWIRGLRKPTPRQVDELASMFGSTPDTLYAMLDRIPPDIEKQLRKASADEFAAVRVILN